MNDGTSRYLSGFTFSELSVSLGVLRSKDLMIYGVGADILGLTEQKKLVIADFYKLFANVSRGGLLITI